MSKLQSVTVPLSEPIIFGSETIAEITLKRIKFKHLRGIKDLNAMGTDEMGYLISRISGQPEAVIDELDAEDLIALGEALQKLSPVGLKIRQE